MKKERTNIDETSDEDIPNWYTIGCIPGRDNKVYDALSAKLKNGAWTNVYFDCVMAYEEEQKVRELKSGEQKITIKKHNLYPEYIFVHCIMTNELWYEIRNTPGVKGIIGSHGGGTKPTPITEAEIRQILTLAGRDVPPIETNTFKLNDTVKILNGPFKNKKGKFISVDKANLATLEIELFNKISTLTIDVNLLQLDS